MLATLVFCHTRLPSGADRLNVWNFKQVDQLNDQNLVPFGWIQR